MGVYTIGELLADLLVELRDDGRITDEQYRALRTWRDEARKLHPDTIEAPDDPVDEDEGEDEYICDCGEAGHFSSCSPEHPYWAPSPEDDL